MKQTDKHKLTMGLMAMGLAVTPLMQSFTSSNIALAADGKETTETVVEPKADTETADKGKETTPTTPEVKSQKVHITMDGKLAHTYTADTFNVIAVQLDEAGKATDKTFPITLKKTGAGKYTATKDELPVGKYSITAEKKSDTFTCSSESFTYTGAAEDAKDINISLKLVAKHKVKCNVVLGDDIVKQAAGKEVSVVASGGSLAKPIVSKVPVGDSMSCAFTLPESATDYKIQVENKELKASDLIAAPGTQTVETNKLSLDNSVSLRFDTIRKSVLNLKFTANSTHPLTGGDEAAVMELQWLNPFTNKNVTIGNFKANANGIVKIDKLAVGTYTIIPKQFAGMKAPEPTTVKVPLKSDEQVAVNYVQTSDQQTVDGDTVTTADVQDDTTRISVDKDQDAQTVSNEAAPKMAGPMTAAGLLGVGSILTAYTGYRTRTNRKK